jgi:glycerophosphoryl diester phosphodiesterase
MPDPYGRNEPDERHRSEKVTLRIGHRGAAGHAPENTLASIRTAIALGVDLVELDVQRTADDELVIMHDKRVDRTTGGRGYVSQMKLDELRRLDAGGGERIPTVHEVLEAARGRTGLMLEIVSPGIGDELHAMVSRSGFGGAVIYASFLHSEVAAIRRIDSNAQTLALIEAVPVDATAFARDARVTHVGLSVDSVTPDFVQALQSDGFKVFVYTVNDRRDIDWLKSLRVDGLISDFPERL